jgi:chitinase
MDAYADTIASGGSSPRFQLSIAAPAGADNYANLPLGEISQATDFINLMVSSSSP